MDSAKLNRALWFLADQQLADGSFKGESSPSVNRWQTADHYTTCFVPALILNSLVEVPGSQQMRQKISQFLLKQKSAHWSFNYWPRHGAEQAKFPYPDDLDDTFCALIGLYRHNPKLVDAATLAKITQLLISNEEKVGGPYRTWLNSDWPNVDLAVNANVAYFLSLIGSSPPPLQRFLAGKIQAGNYQSDFYPSPFPIWYYLARVCPPDCRVQLKQAILAASPTNALQIALKLSALRQLKTPAVRLKPLVKQLLGQQVADGSWPAAAFCLDPSQNGQKYYHGSAALTTALALEALTVKPAAPTTKDHPPNTLQNLIVRRARADIALLAPDLARSANALLGKILAADRDHKITLLPYYFGQSLATPLAATNTFYLRLGLANLYGWLAYTIYDDFMDEEGRPALLPVANWAMRQSLEYFRLALPGDLAFQQRVSQTFTVIDEVNAWEIANCRSRQRLPNYGRRDKLAERSLGHTLTPQAVLIKAGYSLESPEVLAVR